MPFRPRSLPLLFVATSLVACDDSSGPASLPPLSHAITTLLETVVPSHARLADPDQRNPSDVPSADSMLADGYGDFTIGAGETHIPLVTAGAAAPTPGPGAHSLLRFAHFADLQLADDESPGRLTLFDFPGATSAASRAQDGYDCRMVAAMTRSINAVHAESPLSFVLMGGDNVDNAQSNELDWVLTLLGEDGGTLHCDSGADDDPVPGPNNDPKDPFVAPGLRVPFRWVMGNHDVLSQGNFVIDDSRQATVVGSSLIGGARDYANAGGSITTGTVPADPKRRYVSSTELLGRVAAHGDGHGITIATASTGRATYTFDVPGTNFRFLVIDTTSPFGAADGLIRQGDVTNTLVPLLDAARTEGKWVFLASHHATTSLTNGGGTGGQAQTDAITGADFVDLVTSYPNVVASFVGHTHRHRIRELTGNGRSVWEIMTAALADYPHQARVVEIFDEDNGYLRIRLTGLDFAIENDALAKQAKRLGLVDYVSAWADDAKAGELATDRNVDIYVPKPTP